MAVMVNHSMARKEHVPGGAARGIGERERHGTPLFSDVAIVVIGRNEGERLIDCLRSIGSYITRTVYVDSGSSDGSVHAAVEMGAVVVLLDLTTAFTAARARNAGFQAVTHHWPDVTFVQFVDGDCQLDKEWIGVARAFLLINENAALAFGRRRERYPERSVYNALCDSEWNGAPGQVQECGGDILIRAGLLRQTGGYRGDLIAGEEPELCVRLRESGWGVWRLESEMTRHDANIDRFVQWWRRSVRSGHAFAEVSSLHRKSPYRIWQRNVRRAFVWAAVLPVMAISGASVYPEALVLLALYPLQVARLALRQPPRNIQSWRHALFAVMGKFPELQGALRFYVNSWRGKKQAIIEYK